MITKKDIARAAGVTMQAVSNWARRHPDLPQTVQSGSASGYSAPAVAAWLDHRDIQRHELREGEAEGHAYGARFRLALGLPIATSQPPGQVPSTEVPGDELWPQLEQMLGKTQEPWHFEAAVLSLVCLKGTDDSGWTAIARSTMDTVRDTIMLVVRKQRKDVAQAISVLDDATADQWLRHHLLGAVRIIAQDPAPPARTFEYLLDRFAKFRHQSPDEYLLPVEIARLMAKLLDPQAHSHVHDPCCGSGGLLIAASKHRSGSAGPVLTGRAATRRTWGLATMNMAINGVRMDIGDGPRLDPSEVDVDPERFDRILLNPPFGLRTWRLPTSRSRPWPFGEPSPHNATFAWLQIAFEALVPGGQAAVVLPRSAASAFTNRELNIRAGMVDSGAIRCVVSLPSHLFRETTVPVMIWILEKPTSSSAKEILLIQAQSSARKDSATHRILTADGCQSIVEAYTGWLGGSDEFHSQNGISATTASIEEVRENGYDLQPGTYIDRHRRSPAAERKQALLRTLPGELRRLDQQARLADAALANYLEKLATWTR